MFHYHRMELILDEIKKQHGVNFQGVKDICSKQAGPSNKTLENMCYVVDHNIFKSSYLDFITSLNQYFARDGGGYLNAEIALKNFLKNADNEDLITINKSTLQGILMSSSYRAQFYTNSTSLTYSEWLDASEYNETLLIPANSFDFNPQNEFQIRQYFEALNINLEFREMNQNNIEIKVQENKYSPFIFQLLLRSTEWKNESILWCSEFYLEVFRNEYNFEEIVKDIISALEKYAIDKGFKQLYFTTDFYNYGNMKTQPYVKPFEVVLVKHHYLLVQNCRFYGSNYTGFFKPLETNENIEQL